MANSAAKNVAGRKAIVMAAMTFMEELSSLADCAKFMPVNASPRVIILKIYEAVKIIAASAWYSSSTYSRNLISSSPLQELY